MSREKNQSFFELIWNVLLFYSGCPYLGKKHASLFLGTEYGEETARQIDSEVKAVVQESYQRVRTLLKEKRSVLGVLAGRLEEKEVLSGEEVEAIVKRF